MALFMLVGQFAFFHFHVHLDEEKHQSASVKLSIEKYIDQSVDHMLSETLDNRHCEVCDLYLSKKLDVGMQFVFSFSSTEQDTHAIAPSVLSAVQKIYLQLRAPPVTHA